MEAYVQDAVDKFVVTNDVTWAGGRWVRAENGHGSQYEVVVTELPFQLEELMGASHLVSLTQPYRNCYPMWTRGGELFADYVEEKFKIGNPIDLAGVTQIIAHVLDREPIIH